MQATDTNHTLNGPDDASSTHSPPPSRPASPVRALANNKVGERKPRSPVWDHFRRVDDYKISRKTICMHCDKTVLASCGSTTAMHSHLKKFHPDACSGPLNR